FFTAEHPFTARQLAELVWLISQRNILTFLEGVPEHRKHRVYFEDLVSDPAQVMEGVARFLGLEFDPLMADPYKEGERSRMTDPARANGRMLGDVKFHTHRGVDARAAERVKD